VFDERPFVWTKLWTRRWRNPLPLRRRAAYDVGTAAEDPGPDEAVGPQRLRGATAYVRVVACAPRHPEREEGGNLTDGFP
jgi:hypothetical protein